MQINKNIYLSHFDAEVNFFLSLALISPNCLLLLNQPNQGKHTSVIMCL